MEWRERERERLAVIGSAIVCELGSQWANGSRSGPPKEDEQRGRVWLKKRVRSGGRESLVGQEDSKRRHGARQKAKGGRETRLEARSFIETARDWLSGLVTILRLLQRVGWRRWNWRLLLAVAFGTALGGRPTRKRWRPDACQREVERKKS